MKAAASRRLSRRLRFTVIAWFHLALFQRTTARRLGLRIGGRAYRGASFDRLGGSGFFGVPPRRLVSRCWRRVYRDLCNQEE